MQSSKILLKDGKTTVDLVDNRIDDSDIETWNNKLNVDGSNATNAGVTAMMKKVESGSADLNDDSTYFGDSNDDHTHIVRRPILNLWNYIKNKVQTQLLGSVGSADKPIYLENGIPKIATGVSTKTDLNNLTDAVNNHTTEIGQIEEDVVGIKSSLTNKKDKQSANTFNGSSTKTVKTIIQNANGELTVEFEDIDLPKKVAVNLNQDFTPEEMTTARNNIGASKISYDNVVTDMTVSKEVVRPYMNIKYTATVGNDNFLLMSDAFTDGMVVKSNGSLKTQPIPESGDKFDICQYLLKSNERNKTVLDKKHISNNYKEYAGNIGFTTTTSGNMSICAFDSNEQLIYPTQCVNFAGPSTGVTNFIPFTFKEEPDKERISYIGIKGASNGNATITHLFYIGKK